MATGKPREEARRARNDVYRQHILEAAERVFAEQGFEAAKVQAISQRARLSMGTIYAVFPSKADLFRAILEGRGAEVLGLARDVAARGLAPREALHALIDVYVGFFVGHPDFLRMQLRAGTSWALGPAAPSSVQISHWTDVMALQADIFRRGIAAGVFVDEDPAQLSRLFSVMDQVLLADWVSDGMRAGRAALVERMIALCERTFCTAAPGGARGERAREPNVPAVARPG
jgi:AcrR family transcriptional regulator